MFKFYVLVLQILALVCLSRCIQPINIRVDDGVGLDVDVKPFSKIGNGTYFISENSELNWYQAYENCRSMDAELVTFETVEEWNEVTKHLTGRNKRNDFWTSGNDLANNGVFNWFKNAQPINIDVWAPKKYRGDGHCVTLGYAASDSTVLQLNDRNCNNDKRLCNYICEADPLTISVLIWK